jgi:short/branched chain acyl-CoA dehydrogenase
MTAFELSREHEEFRRSVREFAKSEIAPYAAEWDEKHYFPVEVVAKMGDLGLFGLTAPDEYGGAGEDGDFTSLCVAIEEVGRYDQGLGITLESGVGLGINPILTYGTDAQREKWLPDLVAGRAISGFGLTEPGSGSDAGATRTTAELRDGEWVINGSKQFITNSGSSLTSVVTVTARTGTRPDGRPEISSIIVPSRTRGFTAEPSYNKLGWHSSDTHPLSFTDVHVPEDHLLGVRGKGYAQFLATLDDGRVAIAALAVGCIQACVDLAVDYAGERTTFGVPIGAKQGVAFQIADLHVMAQAARMLTYKAAAMKDARAPIADFKQAASVAKLYSTEAAVTATRIATQVFGGYGFMEEYPIARFYRDAKVLEIGEGTSEVQRMLIARSLGLPVE